MIKVGLDVGDEGVDPLVFVRMDHHAGALIQEHQVFIFVDDVQLRLEDRQEGVFRGRGLKKLVIDIKLEQVPLLEAGVPLGTLAVELHPLDADVLLGQGGREDGEGLAQPPVQSLAGVILPDGEFPHKKRNLSCLDFSILPIARRGKSLYTIWSVCRY